MDNRRVLSALCYFSILFTPFLLPIIIYFITPDPEVKRHAKRSLLSHAIPVALGIVGFIILMVLSLTMYSTSDFSIQPGTSVDFFAASIPLLFLIVYGVLSIAVLIWNIIQGIKVLQ
ncbi:DUF4870 domain-containing protein [Paenisporosarcina sp. TG-14]|uniref:DUF4870 domain-containing protein n=1 Tax=Paenisporosarcina sp. TG-14 TaxID=1231057 RepID=UPI0002FB9CFB|nr:DUF4870 domain-containing protein [Paenisporosarcina sp. TG-14]